MGVCVLPPYIDLCDSRIFVFPDPTHLLKSMCNMLFEYSILYGGGMATWKKMYHSFILKMPKKFCPTTDPLPGGAGRPKFNQLEMVTTFTYRPSLAKIDVCNFELS